MSEPRTSGEPKMIWLVRNIETKLVVSGPWLTQEEAQCDADRRDWKWEHVDPVPFQVVSVEEPRA